MFYSMRYPVSCCHHQTGDESHPSAAVEDILLTPDKLRDLDLDAFAEELERQVRPTCTCITLTIHVVDLEFCPCTTGVCVRVYT